MHRVHVFLNHRSTQKSHRDWEKLIRTKLYRSALTVSAPPSSVAFALEIKRAIQEKVDVIIAVGGDGTINQIIQDLAGQETIFLILPAGAANDLARSLGVYASSMQKAIDAVRQDHWQRIDLLSVNGRFMATNGGIGLVSDVAQNVNRLRQLVPGFRLLMGVVKQEVYGILLGGQLLTMGMSLRRLRIDSDRFNGEITTPLLLVNNQAAIGGKFVVAPRTRHDDGLFNVTIFRPKTTAEFITSVYRVRRRVWPENDPQVISFETRKLRLTALDGLPLHFIGDGELLISAPVLDIDIMPRALKVFTQNGRSVLTGQPQGA